MDSLWLIVGLGNPGRRYNKTWHNLGRMGIDVLAKRHRIALRRRRFGGITGEGRIADQRVLLLQPDTYMNRSGESLIRAMSFYKIPNERIIVLYDDYDIPLSRIRIRETGSAGTHNGMKSIIDHL
ncbi:MAG: aminoacyl-tRNA hydrolase, partial [Clostridia bacterium]|nr:aminoacyl-tRNA hydrolase [Clostridia bacterium]